MPGKAVAKSNQKLKGKSSKDEDEAYNAPKNAKQKKEKDPNAPKKPMSAYFLFLNDRRKDIKREKPTLTMCQQTKEATVEWNKMTEKEKKKWQDLQVKEKQRYEKEMQTYDKSNGTA